MSGLCSPIGRTGRSLCARKRWQAALSLTETMLSISLSMPLVLGAMQLLCTSVAEQAMSHQSLRIDQDAQFVLNLIANAVQLAGHHDPYELPSFSALPRVQGLDDATLGARTSIESGQSGAGLFGSDVLIVRFSGAGPGIHALMNCAGIPVSASVNNEATSVTQAQGDSIFYVARGTGGENELRCKYRTASGWDSEALVQGVESFQVLYGLDHDGDGLPEQFLRASAISDAMPRGVSAVSLWNKVVAVKISLLMRSAQRVQQPLTPVTWNLFGDVYSARYATTDRGTRLSSDDFTGESRYRLRRSYEQLIFIRNPLPLATSE